MSFIAHHRILTKRTRRVAKARIPDTASTPIPKKIAVSQSAAAAERKTRGPAPKKKVTPPAEPDEEDEDEDEDGPALALPVRVVHDRFVPGKLEYIRIQDANNAVVLFSEPAARKVFKAWLKTYFEKYPHAVLFPFEFRDEECLVQQICPGAQKSE